MNGKDSLKNKKHSLFLHFQTVLFCFLAEFTFYSHSKKTNSMNYKRKGVMGKRSFLIVSHETRRRPPKILRQQISVFTLSAATIRSRSVVCNLVRRFEVEIELAVVGTPVVNGDAQCVVEP